MSAVDDLRRTLGLEGIETTNMELLVELADLTIPTLPVPRERSLEMWKGLRGLVPRTGRWPVLFHDPDGEERERLVEDSFEEVPGWESVQNAIQRSRTLDVTGWLAANLRAHEQGSRGLPRGDWPAQVRRSQSAGGFPPRPATPDGDEFWACTGVRSRGQISAEVLIALVPVLESWQVAPAMAFGGWNECPFGFEHAAVHRYWSERFGAEVVAMNTNTVELWVARPPMERGSSIDLALEQFAYCEDIIYQGYQTVEGLAAILTGSQVWSFWWD